MSFVHTHNVLLNSDLTKGQKLVLGVIGTFTDQGGKCWPAVETIAARCAMCVRTVQGHINDLVRLHYLTRTYRKGRSAITQLTEKAMGWLSGTPAKTAPPPPQKLHPEPVIEPAKEITAQAAAPVVAENPAVAAVVVFESVDTEAMDTEPVVDLVPALPVIDNPLADVPAALLDDFGIVRKAKKKPAAVTRTEAVVFATEAAKAGMTVAQAVEHCIHRGWSRFDAQWVPAAPAMTLQRVYVPEVAPPASPDIVRAELAKLAAQPGPTAKMADPLAWAKSTLARHQAGEHVSGFALRSARAALRL